MYGNDNVTKRPFIGIVGGLGPEAGRLLHGILITEMTRRFGAERDQDHLDIIHLSFPAQVPDRGTYIFDQSAPCPNDGVLPILTHMASIGKSYGRPVYAVIPCHTYHAPILYDDLTARIESAGLGPHLNLVHLVDRAIDRLTETFPTLTRVGLIATTGSRKTHIFDTALARAGIELLPLSPDHQALVDDAIYNPDDSLKALSAACPRVKGNLDFVIDHLKNAGAQKVLLGCTELPLAYGDGDIAPESLLSSPMHLAASYLVDQVLAHDRESFAKNNKIVL